MRRTAASTIVPAAVSCMPRGSRSNSGAPTWASKFRTCWCTAAALRCNVSAALRTEPWRATASRQRNDWGIGRIVELYGFFTQGGRINQLCLTIPEA